MSGMKSKSFLGNGCIKNGKAEHMYSSRPDARTKVEKRSIKSCMMDKKEDIGLENA